MKKWAGVLALRFLIGIIFNAMTVQSNTETSIEDFNSKVVIAYVPGYDPNEIAAISNSDSQLTR